MNTVSYSDYCGNSPMGYVNGWHSKLREERYTFGDLCSQYTHTHTYTPPLLPLNYWSLKILRL